MGAGVVDALVPGDADVGAEGVGVAVGAGVGVAAGVGAADAAGTVVGALDGVTTLGAGVGSNIAVQV